MIEIAPLAITTLKSNFLEKANVCIDVLRLDAIHPHISGNKFFKLKYNIDHVLDNGLEGIISFGGAYSNHLHALACAGNMHNIKTIGIVRGDEVENETLKDCIGWGMKLIFIPRSDYKIATQNSSLPQKIKDEFPNYYILPEGGANELAVKACTEILKDVTIANYNKIAVSVGTATTLIGILESCNIPIMAFASFKKAAYMHNTITAKTKNTNYTLIDDYCFGGFGKINSELRSFMKSFYKEYGIELDRIYTAKMMYGILEMVEKKQIHSGEKLLVLHTGGLQGNRTIL